MPSWPKKQQTKRTQMHESVTIKSVKLSKADLPPLDSNSALPEHFLVELELSNGFVLEKDLEPFLTGPVFSQRKMDRQLFEKVSVKNGALAWTAQIELNSDLVLGKQNSEPELPLPAGIASVVLLTPFCLIVIPGFFLWILYEKLSSKRLWRGEAGDYESWLICILGSMAFWTLLAGICILFS